MASAVNVVKKCYLNGGGDYLALRTCYFIIALIRKLFCKIVMKGIRKIIGVLIIAALASCEDVQRLLPKATFDSSFPKRNRNLANILGDLLVIKSGNDTVTLKISSSQNSNVVTNNETGDTVFNGIVSKYRGLYYFSQQFNDTTYWIYAVKITDNLIYGLNTGWEQMLRVEKAIESGKHQKLIKYVAKDNIRLHPDKKELKELFKSIIDSIPPDTVLQPGQKIMLTDTTEIAEQIDSEEFDYFSKVYPNPTSDILNIELQKTGKTIYHLSDIQGKTILEGQFTDKRNQVDLSNQAPGIYALTLIDPLSKQKETIKIIKKE